MRRVALLLPLHHHPLEVGHVRDVEMTVGQEDPVAELDSLVDGWLSLSFPLSSAESDDDQVLTLSRNRHSSVDSAALSNVTELCCWIHTRREDKDDRRRDGVVVDQVGHVERRRLGVLRSEFGCDKLRGSEEHAIGTEATDDDETLQVVRLGLPLAGEGNLFRFGASVPATPLAGVCVEGLEDAVEVVELVEFGDVVPLLWFLLEPLDLVLRLQILVDHNSSAQEEVVFGDVDLLVGHQQLDAHLEREQDFVLFEQTTHDVSINVVEMDGVEESDTVSNLRRLLLLAQLLQGDLEALEVRVEGVLIHRVHRRQVDHDEEEERSAAGSRAVSFSCFVDLCVGLLHFGCRLLDAVGSGFAGLQDVHHFLVVDERLGWVEGVEELQDLVLQPKHLRLVLCNSHNEVVLLFVEVGVLLLDNHSQKLLFESLLLHCKVDDGCFCGDFG
ncbi:hypothetical protein BLNAU_15614 [Blattamonas nauphoetae]|uniref:Uncharacterized protein n=1 Tax=Blattamonas nauphoetae TaxID=2049346 RepID=A0ABQ9XEZ1_9EUKA|nr:hypothetical protein BLNAU_15614 [Blattamonas nauphoetae]